MTLDTRIYVHDPVDVYELFREGQRLLHITDLDPKRDLRTPDRMVWKDDAETVFRDGKWVEDTDGERSIGNQFGQGLPAILRINYREGGPLKPNADDCDRYCDDPCDRESPHKPAMWCEISLDTTYGYETAIGGCGDLHAVLIAAFGHWLTQRGVTFSWMNEFTGDVYQGTDGLDTLSENGEKAAAWFRDVAQPAIEARIGASTTTPPA